MTQSVLGMAKDLGLALIDAGTLPPDHMPDFIRDTHTFLMQLKEQESAVAAGVVSNSAAPAGVDWKSSITQHAIICLECRGSFRQLSDRHFKQHGLDSRSYRQKYGIPRSQSLAAKETTARRKQIVWQIKPWEKTTPYLQRQGQQPGAAVKRAERRSAATRTPRQKKASSKAAARKR